MKKKEFDDLIDVMEKAGYEVESIQTGEYPSQVDGSISYYVRIKKLKGEEAK